MLELVSLQRYTTQEILTIIPKPHHNSHTHQLRKTWRVGTDPHLFLHPILPTLRHLSGHIGSFPS